LDASVAKGFAFLEPIQPGKDMLVRIVAMLTKLVVRFEAKRNPRNRPHDAAEL
jgi:hypothetical protein